MKLILAFAALAGLLALVAMSPPPQTHAPPMTNLVLEDAPSLVNAPQVALTFKNTNRETIVETCALHIDPGRTFAATLATGSADVTVVTANNFARGTLGHQAWKETVGMIDPTLLTGASAKNFVSSA